MKVLVADKFEQSGLDGLKAAGCEVFFEPEASGDTLITAIKKTQAPVLVVRSTQVTDAMMDAGALSLIVRAGAGVNTIDVAAASKRGIYVSNCPGRNSVAVAELAMGLILALDRRIPDNVAELRAGTWNKKEYSKAKGLKGQTLGLLGFGNIGREVAVRARAFGMRVLVWSRRFSSSAELKAAAQDEFDIEVVDTPQQLMSSADVVSIHRSGAGGDCRGDGSNHPHIQGHRQGPERRQPGEAHTGHTHAGGQASRQARCPRARL